MPSQLQRRLVRFLDSGVARQVSAVEVEPHNDNVPAPTPAEKQDPANKPSLFDARGYRCRSVQGHTR